MANVTIHNANGEIVEVIDGQLHVLATNESEFEHISETASLSFCWSTVAADYTAGETLLIVQNTSDSLLLHIEEISFSSDLLAEFDIHTIAGATTPSGGTAVVGRCLNVASPKVAPAVGHSDDTANSSQGNIIWSNRVTANTVVLAQFGGAVILGKNDAIAVDITDAPTALANCNIAGYFKVT